MGRVRALALLLLVAAAARADGETLGPAREVVVTPLRGGGQGVRLTLAAGAPEGSLVAAALLEEQQAPPVSTNQAGVRGGGVVVLLRLGERPPPGLYEAHLAYDPTAQPRWVASRGAPGRRVVPIVVGTVAEAQAGRDQAVAAGRRADAVVAAAAEAAQAFGPRAAPWRRTTLQAWLAERAAPRAHALEAALQALSPRASSASEEAALAPVGARALVALATRARAACLEHEVPLPAAFAAAGPVVDADLDDLLVGAGRARPRAPRRPGARAQPADARAPRPARGDAPALARSAPADAARPRGPRLTCSRTRALAVARVRPALLATATPPRRRSPARWPATRPDLARARPGPTTSPRAPPAGRPCSSGRPTCRRSSAPAPARKDRAALVDCARVAEAGADAAAAAAWRGRSPSSSAGSRAPQRPRARLAAALAEAGAAARARRPAPAEVERRWVEALAALDALLGGAR
ncbi:MAG: hypothetical protein KF878_34560 [Planctomycetes bacterium]|nr:hypothetical protein [Planctomycetota bacterium]